MTVEKRRRGGGAKAIVSEGNGTERMDGGMVGWNGRGKKKRKKKQKK